MPNSEFPPQNSIFRKAIRSKKHIAQQQPGRAFNTLVLQSLIQYEHKHQAISVVTLACNIKKKTFTSTGEMSAAEAQSSIASGFCASGGVSSCIPAKIERYLFRKATNGGMINPTYFFLNGFLSLLTACHNCYDT